MRIDPKVNRSKYDRELSRLQERRGDLEHRGVYLLESSAYPLLDLLFVAHHPLRIWTTQLRQGNLFLGAPVLVAQDIEVLAPSAFTARFDLSDYDLEPPSLVFLNPWTGSPLFFNKMFRALEYNLSRGPHEVLIADHPLTHMPFLCVRGIREYHFHAQHSGDEWLLYRPSMNLFSIILSVWRVCVDLPRLQLSITESGCQFTWAAEEKP
jgi:Predicted metal binding domain